MVCAKEEIPFSSQNFLLFLGILSITTEAVKLQYAVGQEFNETSLSVIAMTSGKPLQFIALILS
jgi:hypothetical protein